MTLNEVPESAAASLQTKPNQPFLPQKPLKKARELQIWDGSIVRKSGKDSKIGKTV